MRCNRMKQKDTHLELVPKAVRGVVGEEEREDGANVLGGGEGVAEDGKGDLGGAEDEELAATAARNGRLSHQHHVARLY